jgi:hypothetical protein
MSHQNKINLGENLGRATWGKFKAANICVIQLIALNLVITKMTFDCESPIMTKKWFKFGHWINGESQTIVNQTTKNISKWWPKTIWMTTNFFSNGDQFFFKCSTWWSNDQRHLIAKTCPKKESLSKQNVNVWLEEWNWHIWMDVNWQPMQNGHILSFLITL